ncbi:MAG: SpoIID/LytB domain-containing protein [Clostridia bacterium]|nr:SpoIID/LytB domain-containing protein [Clostridia bacterium]
MNEKTKLIVRILCLIMALLMILGVVVSLVQSFMFSVHAEETEAAEDDLLFRVGLLFGDDAPVSYTISAEKGFSLGYSDKETNVFTSVLTVASTSIAVCQDGNLSLSSGIYSPSNSGVTIGGYHLQLQSKYYDVPSLQAALKSVNGKLSSAGILSNLIYAFPYTSDGVFYIRIGDFASTVTATSKKASVAAALGEEPGYAYPDQSVMSFVDVSSNRILFEGRSNRALMTAYPTPSKGSNGKTTAVPVVTPKGNPYLGSFCFQKEASGVTVMNIVRMDDYVASCMSFEIGSSWPEEALKAFAVCSRSFAISYRGKHASLGFDFCPDSDCQAYGGSRRDNEIIRKAIADTKGLVVSCDGEVCIVCYTAATAGGTVSNDQCWNAPMYRYLRAVRTPWEDYRSHPYGEWVTTVSASELGTYLRGRGYTQLQGAVASMQILELAEKTTYIYRLNIKDVYGNSVTIKGTDYVRSALAKYVKSADFIIAKNGIVDGLQSGFSVKTLTGTIFLPVPDSSGKKTMSVLTGDGVREVDTSAGLRAKSANGEVVFSPVSTEIPDYGKEAVNKAGKDQFVLIGKGYGHGCGISQWGAKNLSEQGYSYEEIIHAYLTDVTIEPYTNVTGTKAS